MLIFKILIVCLILLEFMCYNIIIIFDFVYIPIIVRLLFFNLIQVDSLKYVQLRLF